MFRKKNDSELEIIAKIEGIEIYRCPLTEEQSLNKNLGMSKDGRLFCMDGNRPKEIKAYEQWKEKGRRRVEYKVRLEKCKDGIKLRKRYNIARLMCVTFFCYTNGTELDIKGDWTVDHLHLIVQHNGFVSSDTKKWDLNSIDVCTLEENRRRWLAAQKAIAKGMN